MLALTPGPAIKLYLKGGIACPVMGHQRDTIIGQGVRSLSVQCSNKLFILNRMMVDGVWCEPCCGRHAC